MLEKWPCMLPVQSTDKLALPLIKDTVLTLSTLNLSCSSGVAAVQTVAVLGSFQVWMCLTVNVIREFLEKCFSDHPVLPGNTLTNHPAFENLIWLIGVGLGYHLNVLIILQLLLWWRLLLDQHASCDAARVYVLDTVVNRLATVISIFKATLKVESQLLVLCAILWPLDVSFCFSVHSVHLPKVIKIEASEKDLLNDWINTFHWKWSLFIRCLLYIYRMDGECQSLNLIL